LICAIAHAEWLWLQAYHAADAPAFLLSDIAALSPDALLATPVLRHPAAHILPAPIGLATAFGLKSTGTGSDAYLLITRPDVDVMVDILSKASATILALLDSPQPLSDVLEATADRHPDVDILALCIALLQRGAIMQKAA
jgi:hypothetical protein